jgi:hypothetical protein
MQRIELLDKAYAQNEAFLFFQTDKKIIAKHKKISKILEKEIRNEIRTYCEDVPDNIKKMTDSELLAELSA